MATKKITLNELRTLVKQIIKEYDVDKIDRDYPKLPDGRKKGIKDFLTTRQIGQGFVFSGVENSEDKYYLTRDAITGMFPIMLSNYDINTDSIKYAPSMIDILNDYKESLSLGFKKILDRYKLPAEVIIDLKTKPYNLKDSIPVNFSIAMRNLMDKDGKNHDFTLKIYGSLKKKSDKYTPPFKLHIYRIDIENNGLGKIIPNDNAGKKFITDKITELVKKNYKFSNNQRIFIDEIIIDRNSFYK